MTDALQNLLMSLKQDNSLKAWSLIITFFGDSIAPRGGIVSAATIQSVMQLCGIGSGTVRTALSRLGKDGWVERDKSGRNSFYRLSAKGVAQSTEASARIYAAPAVNDHNQQALCLVISAPGQSLPNSLIAASIALTGNTHLVPSAHNALSKLNPHKYLIAEVTNPLMPDWVEAALLPESLAFKYKQLCARVESIDAATIASNSEALALRTILIHEWRRLRLKPGQTNQTTNHTVQQVAHQVVARLYHELSPRADQWLQQHARGPNGPLPDADIVINARFLQDV